MHSLPENGIGTGNVTVLSGSSRRALQRSNSAEDVTPNNQKVGHYYVTKRFPSTGVMLLRLPGMYISAYNFFLPEA